MTNLSSAVARMIRIDDADRMYVTTNNGIFVFNSAHTATGNIPPDRTIQTNNSFFPDPFGLALDTTNDRAFLVNAAGTTLELITGVSTANGTISASGSASTTGVVPPIGIAINLN